MTEDRTPDTTVRLISAVERGELVDAACLGRQWVRGRQLAGEAGPWSLPGPTGVWGHVPNALWRELAVSVDQGNPSVVHWTSSPRLPEGFSGPAEAVDAALQASHEAAPVDRGSRPVRLDPFLDGIEGIDAYRNEAQREAVRAALRCPPGGVCHVVLPTGTGKSLVGLARGIVGGRTTIIVVPTVALAIDQERKLRTSQVISTDPGHRFAYTGRLGEAEKNAIVDRLGAGTQRVLLTSPEALVGPRIASRLHGLAERGQIDALVIDESHLTATWGRTFRPQFQLLGALRRSLHERALGSGRPSFATITLTGTMTQATAETLRHVFPSLVEKGEAFVGSTWVRPEPRFCLVERPSLESARSTVRALMRMLPRPGIVYVNRVDEAEADHNSRRVRGTPLRKVVDEGGLRRWRAFTGPTPYPEKQQRFAAWSGETVDDQWISPTADWMVGTSAFGLGIDVSDVRSIIHLGVPETFDRFYQEVGRAGRDGKASLSFLVTYPGALKESASLGRARFLGGEKALPRWRRVYQGVPAEGRPELRLLDVRSRPSGGTPTPLDVAWNVHMVRAMEEADALELLVDPSVASDAEEEDVDEARAQGPVAPPLIVACRSGDLPLNPDTADAYDQLVEPARAAADARNAAEQELLHSYLSGERCVGALIADAYTVGIADLAQFGAAAVARGCPSCGSSPCPGAPDGAWTFGYTSRPHAGFPAANVGAAELARTILVQVRTPADVSAVLHTVLRHRLPRVAGSLQSLDRPSRRAVERGLRWVVVDDERTAHPAMSSLILAMGVEVSAALLNHTASPGNVLAIDEATSVHGERFPIVKGGPRILSPDLLAEELAMTCS